MQINFVAPAILVKDIGISTHFYRDLLGQNVSMDNGRHVSFGNLSLWEYEHAHSIIFNKTASVPAVMEPHTFELYFETDELDDVFRRLSECNVKNVHGIHEHPWGQRGFRVYDPDGHIIEISEPLTVVVKRLLKEGLTIPQISERTSIPEHMVKEMARV